MITVLFYATAKDGHFRDENSPFWPCSVNLRIARVPIDTRPTGPLLGHPIGVTKPKPGGHDAQDLSE